MKKWIKGTVIGLALMTSYIVDSNAGILQHVVQAQTTPLLLDVSLGNPSVEGAFVYRHVSLDQAMVRRQAIEELQKLRREMWDINPKYNGKTLQEVAKSEGLTTKEAYATAMAWDINLEKFAIQRAVEAGIISDHVRTDLTGYGIGFENLAWGYNTVGAISRGWGHGELNDLQLADGQFNYKNGHLHTQLNPTLRRYGVATINGTTAGAYNWQKSDNTQGTNYTGEHTVVLKIKNELRELDGALGYVINNYYRPEVTGLMKHTDQKTYYVKNGVVANTFTGLEKLAFGTPGNETGKYDITHQFVYIRNGQWQEQFTGLVQHQTNKRWFYVKNGKIDWKFTGLAQHQTNKRWFYVKNGEIDWKFTGLAQHQTNKRWFYVKNGEIDWKFTGLIQHQTNKRWFYVKNGEIDWKFTGSVQNTNGKWYYVKNGEINWQITKQLFG